MLVDGFIASAAALVAVRIDPSCRDALLMATLSGEPGHAACIAAIQSIEKGSNGREVSVHVCVCECLTGPIYSPEWHAKRVPITEQSPPSDPFAPQPRA